MPIEFAEALDVKAMADEIIENLEMFHIVPQFVFCYRSRGSESKRIIARIHGLSKLWQETLRRPSAYIIEVLSEQYDKLSVEEKEKTIIHELLHIPKGFTGGFRPHKGYIDQKRVDKLYETFIQKRKQESLFE